ncbi:glycoside hydrolase family 2 protein [Pedobacter faecalis]|uniref:glycoside hydrolase family 2 protein n=1 Tax=Pedobacter faecalis TaxID=3041495 RepID=UPI00254C28C3|nr:sugar-binding domain-containing protein [Pedobacter sp. ELA7]
MKVKQNLLLATALAISLANSGFAQQDYKRQPIQIQTRWANDVSVKSVLSEYPRPNLTRKNWTNLNGLWDYAITGIQDSLPIHYDGKILVPFPLESSLSGVKKRLEAKQLLWYKANLIHPVIKYGEHILLHFGAVDFETTVFLNGKEVNKHSGGYQNFSLDITNFLREGVNELIVKVWDPSDEGPNPRGKQSLNPGGIWYTASSGIWQTVWLETVPQHYIESLKITPDVDKGLVNIQVNGSSKAPVQLKVLDGKKVVATLSGLQPSLPGKEISLAVKIPNARLWSPDDPFLYDLEVTLGEDKVTSYFGMRKIEVKKDVKGIDRIFLNNKYTYNLGTLDQGYWPEGLYTAPTDDALKFDILAAKAMGFNTIRKHIKIEPARWYYHCDKIGMLVWQDMVNPAAGSGQPIIEAKKQFEKECLENIHQLYNFPSIVIWVLFNENWGAYDQGRLTKWIKDIDPSRIVNGHSGSLIVDYTSKGNTPAGLASKSANSDVTDIHSYPPPGIPAYIAGKALVLGEFGGIGVSVESHLWNDVEAGWGYGGTVSAGVMKKRYQVMIDSLIAFEKRGLSASIYTQPYDVEAEQNGILTYDRKITKIPIKEIRKIHKKLWSTVTNGDEQKEINTLMVADTGQVNFQQALKIYNDGKKDSSQLRLLALMALAEKDVNSNLGERYANEYIKVLKNPYIETNLRFISKFLNKTTDEGFNLFLHNIKGVNDILGKDEAESKLITAIERDEINPVIDQTTIDWSSLLKNMTQKYGEIGQEVVMQKQVMHSVEKSNWGTFNYIASTWLRLYGCKRKWISANMLNDLAWDIFNKTADIQSLGVALEMSSIALKDAETPNRIDTYANLLYKLGSKIKAIEWQKRAVEQDGYTAEFKLTLQKMQNNEKTWPELKK